MQSAPDVGAENVGRDWSAEDPRASIDTAVPSQRKKARRAVRPPTPSQQRVPMFPHGGSCRRSKQTAAQRETRSLEGNPRGNRRDPSGAITSLGSPSSGCKNIFSPRRRAGGRGRGGSQQGSERTPGLPVIVVKPDRSKSSFIATCCHEVQALIIVTTGCIEDIRAMRSASGAGSPSPCREQEAVGVSGSARKELGRGSRRQGEAAVARGGAGVRELGINRAEKW